MSWTTHAPEWITIGLMVGAFVFARRFGGGAALAELERANTVLERSVRELRADNARLTAEVAVLRARTDVAVAIAPVLEALRNHEVQAATRSDAMLAVLGQIAGRLGPEPDGA